MYGFKGKTHGVMRSFLRAGLPMATLVSFATALSGMAPLAAQQRIRGTVIDDSTRRPIPEVALSLIDSYGNVVGRTVRTDSLGAFMLNVPLEGKYNIQAMRIGYLRLTTAAVMVQKRFEVPVQIAMAQSVQLLGALTITGRPLLISRDLDEFEVRRKVENGTFFTKEDIARRGPTDVVSLFRDAAGVRVGQNDEGGLVVTFLRAPTTGDTPCRPVVYLDGLKMSPRAAAGGEDPIESINRMVRPDQLYGVELYSGVSQVPARFAGSDAQCGVILLWTQRAAGGSPN